MFLEKSAFNQLLAVTPLNHVEFSLGYCMGWVPQVLSWLCPCITVQQSSSIGSFYYVGRSVGPLIVALLVDRVGRNPLVTLAALLLFLPATLLLCCGADTPLLVHYATRIAMGASSGITDAVCGMYIGENCSPSRRGVFSGVLMVYFMTGNLTANVVVAYLPHTWANLIGAVFAFASLLSVYLLMEPASYLIGKGRLQEAERNFHWLREGDSDEVSVEFQRLREYIVMDQLGAEYESVWTRLSTMEARKGLRIVLVTISLLMMSGYAAVYSYFTLIVADSTILSPQKLSIVRGCVQFAMMVAGPFVVERFDRRTLFAASCLALFAASASSAVVITVGAVYANSSCVIVLKSFFLTLYCGVYMSISFPLAVAIRSEVLPHNVKALGSGLTIACDSCVGFVVAESFLPVADAFGMQYNFVMFSGAALALCAYVYVDLPETRGKTLVRVQRELAEHELDGSYDDDVSCCTSTSTSNLV